MYSESDLSSAVSAGAISSDAAEALRAHAASLRSAPVADEEQFRLITGFNDIFVTIACALVIFASASVGGEIKEWLGGILVAGASWLMAEMFTRKRRMALPSIVLLLAFAIGLGFAAANLAGLLMPPHVVKHAYTHGDTTGYWIESKWFPWQEATMTRKA